MGENKYRLFVRYLWSLRLPASLFFLFAGVFAGVFYLYNLSLPAEALLYASALCALFGGCVLGIHFCAYCRKHRERERMLAGIAHKYRDMPKAATLGEEDYQKMVYALGELYTERLTGWKKEWQDSLDYYTVWVHQIKTPIAVMRMGLQSEDTRENRELLTELLRIEQYVEMALSYIRLESAGNDFVFRRHELDGIIRQAIRKYAPWFIRRKIRLSYEPTGAVALTDEKWLLFILEQLLSNAVKYTPEGCISIWVTEDGKLSVADTGIGIVPEDLPRIFEKGYTGYNGREDKKATGLGLSLCREAAEKLGIRIWAESEPGKGSVFTLDLRERELEIE